MMSPELTCKACKKRSALNGMKYSKDGSGLICSECYGKENNGVAAALKTAQQPSFLGRTQKDDSPKKKVSFHCTSCAFKWNRSLDFRGPKLCPNCSRPSVVYNLPNDADDLLHELDQMDDV